ncbi:hypothetical protein [Pseudovibrio exalbescens]|uniref:hypothetical protein n=1 Tax=Pseudovibrio exalbescens TaxID=197461 RepID=UPI000C9CDF1C|nr:hypothetical protein [Pseudovibrio exalbescens]
MIEYVSYRVSEARKYGSDAATVLHGLRVFIAGNKSEGQGLKGGAYWVCKSAKGLCSLYPHITQDRMKRILAKLEEAGEITSTSEYNHSPFDRTKWYTMPEFCEADLFSADAHSRECKSAPSSGVDSHLLKVQNCTFSKCKSAPSLNTNPYSNPISNPSLLGVADAPPAKKEKKRGTRLQEDWSPTSENIEYARAKGLSDQRIQFEAEKFRNYWTSKSGSAATKIDWGKTWNNWILNVIERLPAQSEQQRRNNPDRLRDKYQERLNAAYNRG